MPAPATDGAFDVTWYNSTDYPNASDDPYKEIVRVTAKTGDALTVTRAQQGTTASAKNVAGKVYLMVLTPTKKMNDDIIASIPSAFDAAALATVEHAATVKTTPDDSDEVSLLDSASAFILKKITWANIKDAIKSFLLADSQIMEHGMARQAIINGNFDIWQRGTSVAITDLTKQFQADRWHDYIDKNGGTLPTLTRSRQTLTPGDIPGSFFFNRLNTNGSGVSFGVNAFARFSQFIENGTRNLGGSGKTVTVSFYAKSDIANKRISPTVRMSYGTGGSPSADDVIKGTPITLTSTWTKYTQKYSLNTLAGKTFGTNLDDYISIDFFTMWGTTFGNSYVQTGVTYESFVAAGNIDIAQVQLCSGNSALPFQPKSYDDELRACQRFYEEDGTGANFIGNTFNTVNTANGFPAGIWVSFNVMKRIVPTMVVSDASSFSARTTTPSQKGFLHEATSGSTGYGTTAYIYIAKWTANAEL